MYEIIGRTSLRNLHNVKNSNFTKSNYHKVLNMSWKLLIKHKIDCLPVDLKKIISQENWLLFSYKELPYSFNNLKKNYLGFALKTNDCIAIFYNDKLPFEIQRFTIAHEISHIILNNYNLPKAIKEKEADMGSARILMPMCILYECKVSSAYEIATICQTSLEASKIRYDRLKQTLIPRNKWYKSTLELEVKQLFLSFIKAYLKSKIKISFT